MEYMLHWWGGSEKYIKDKYGYEKYLYFNNPKDRDEVKKQLMEFSDYGLVIDYKEGNLTHKDTIAIVTLKYNDKEYTYEHNFGKEFPEDVVRFQYEENNYSCDCNKSLFIQRNCDENFPEFNCGDLIELVNLDIVYK